MSRVLAGVLLGILLVGGPAEVSSQQPDTNADGDLRLVNVDDGTVVDLHFTLTPPSGRLEIFDDEDGDGVGEWKGICDDGLETLGTQEDDNLRVRGRQEAEVACRQLGFSGGTPMTGLALPPNFEGGDDGPSAYYLLDDVECAGSETAILGDGFGNRCGHRLRGQNNCSVDEAFGVACAARTLNNDAVGLIRLTHPEARTGVTLTADHSEIADPDGKPADESAFSYQWIKSDISLE